MSKYPRDEFDRTPEFTDRKGVHREQPAVKGGGTGLGLLMGVGVLALVVGLVSFLVLPRVLGADATAVAAQTTTASSSSSEPAESESAESKPAKSKPAKSEAADASETVAAESPSASATPRETATQEAVAVNYAAPVGVYNGTSVSGLAGNGLAKLQGGGFSSLSAGNWTKKVEASVVYYKSDASRATALETARVLGISTVYQTANIPVEISVVLGRSYG